MALTAAIVGLCLILENADLRAFALFQNLCSDLCACNSRLADLKFITCYQQNLIKNNFSSDFRVKLFYGNLLAFFDDRQPSGISP